MRTDRRSLLAVGAAFAGSSRLAESAPPRFPIMAWIGPPASQTTIEKYRELAQAGFTHTFSQFPSLELMSAALDIGRNVGVKLFVACPELQADPEGVAKRFKSHPALAGYHLRDEPSARDFESLGKWARRVQSVDRMHGCYLNLFPTYAEPSQLGAPDYRSYVDLFLKQVPVPYLSWDHYPIVGDNLRPTYFENFEICAAAARKRGLPIWAFILATAHTPYPIPTPGHLRFQGFTDLAYGVRCIQYFTYWTPEGTQWNFHQGPIEKDGTRTPVYDRVKQMNREIQAASGVLGGSRVVSVTHTAPLPKSARPFTPSGWVKKLSTPGGLVVSHRRGRQSELLLLVNRSFAAPTGAVVEFSSPTTLRYPNTGSPARVRHTLSFEPGACVILESGRR